MKILIAVPYRTRQQSDQAVRCLVQATSRLQPGLTAVLAEKDEHGSLRLQQFHPHQPQVWLHEPAIPDYFEEGELGASLLESLTQGDSALFVVVDEEEACAMVLTLLLLTAGGNDAGANAFFASDDLRPHQRLEAHLETYQAAIAKLDRLDRSATLVEIEQAYQAVDHAYQELIALDDPAAPASARKAPLICFD